MEHAANVRVQAPDAPGGLVVVQDLLNTVPGGTTMARPELIGDAAAAQAWADAVLGDRGWSPRASAAIDEADAAALRALRETVRDLLHGRDHVASASGLVALTLQPSGEVAVEASDAAAGSVVGVVLAEIWSAQERGEWDRLKLCALAACDAAFYDRTRNNSTRYHTKRCANYVNLRNSRERRRG